MSHILQDGDVQEQVEDAAPARGSVHSHQVLQIFSSALLVKCSIYQKQCTSADSRHQPACCCWRTRGSLGGLFLNVCFAVIQMVGTQGSNVNQTQSLEEVMVAEGLSFLERTCNTAQCSGCQLGCFGGQNLPCSIYRRIICSCSYCMEHPKILLYQLLEQIIPH